MGHTEEPIRRQTAYALFRRVLAFALTLTVSQQILWRRPSFSTGDSGILNATRDVFWLI